MPVTPPLNATPNSACNPGKKIEIMPYNPQWPKQFEKEAEKLREALGKAVVAIHHIGSTSVPGLAAKRDVDIMLVINNLQQALLLQRIGYTFKGELNIPLRYFFSRNTAESKVNLHVCEQDHSCIPLQLAFRYRLRNHEEDKAAYQQLKYELAKDPEAGVKLRGVFTKYSLGKHDFIKKTLQKAGYDKPVINFCLHDSEWEAARHYRNTYIFHPMNMEDPYTWTFNHKDHKHLVLYKGAALIGYAHVQLWPENRAALRIIAIDKAKQAKGYGKTLLLCIEKWLKVNGYQRLHIESDPEVIGFYEHLGYTRAPFNDPNDPDGHESYPEDIAVSKIV